MELTIRDWMVIAGVLLIVAVLFDAWRRVRSERYSRVRVKLADAEPPGSERDADLTWLKELPNGGARVVERGDLLRAAGLSQASAAGDMSLAGQIGQAPAAPETPSETSSGEVKTEISDAADEDELELDEDSDEWNF